MYVFLSIFRGHHLILFYNSQIVHFIVKGVCKSTEFDRLALNVLFISFELWVYYMISAANKTFADAKVLFIK